MLVAVCSIQNMCSFFATGANPMDMAAKLISPDGKVEDIEVRDASDSQFIVKFTPRESGLHTISVMHKGQHISGKHFF